MSETDKKLLQYQQRNPRIVELWKALQPLKTCVSFMNTGAHPDDETTPMLAAMALRDGIRVSHACSTRGEGGQNALGTEITKDLGAIRTREMERAAAVIGFTQYWHSETPDDTIFDFGFSKHGDETLEKWEEQRVLLRFVQIIRRERPDIVCPTFLDIPGQHGHHRAMTRSAFRAVVLAADETAFPELSLPVWQVKKLYLPAWSGAGDAYDDDEPPPPATVKFDATGADPILGADYAQIAQWSRRFHATQGMGQWVESGLPSIWPLHLAWVAKGEPGPENTIFDGLPDGLGSLADFAGAPELKLDLDAASVSVVAAIAAYPDYPLVAKHALTALTKVNVATQSCPEKAAGEILHRLDVKRRQLTRVIALASDIRGALAFSDDHVRPGNTFSAHLCMQGSNTSVTPKILLPKGWTASKWENSTCQITVPLGAATSDPYPDTWHPDRSNSQVSVLLTGKISDQKIEMAIDPLARIHVLPTYSAGFSNDQAVLTLADMGTITFKMKDIHPADATPSISAPDGWQVTIQSHSIQLTPQASVKPGLYEFHLQLDGHPARTVRKSHYQHIGKVFSFAPAIIRVLVLDVKLPDSHIAYIGGGSDRVDEHLRNVGMEIDSLSEADLANVDLSNYDTILIGIFAFRTRPGLTTRLGQLHDWVHTGGNLVTLYHRPWDNWDPAKTPPANLKIGKPSLRWRVTDENARVIHMQPEHTLLNNPNKIGPSEWGGWEKERGLYFAAEWDAVYEPLISMADKGEEPLTGALLSARIGQGCHTHTSLILHHQIENLVPGAYRLMANLLTNSCGNN
ncbi:MAG: PIG-L family deacetylase [Paracoccaceae bacterium]